MSINSLGTNLLATLFKKADADESGTLTTQELDSIAAPLATTTGKTQTGSQLLTAYDADHNGTLTAQEFEDGATLDTNVHAALLKAQEITSGATLLGYMNGDDTSQADPFAGLFEGEGQANPLLAPTADPESPDALSTLFDQLMAHYAEGAQSLTEQETLAEEEPAPTPTGSTS